MFYQRRLLSSKSLLIFFLIFFICFCYCNASDLDENSFSSSKQQQQQRVKRQYYDEGYAIGNYYGCGGDDSRQFGRILGWGLGCLLVLLCLCLPCVCCIGIWFAGWFGLRRAMQSRNNAAQQPTQPLSIISSGRRRSVQPTTTTTTIIPPPLSPTSGPLPAGTIIEQRSPSSGMIDEAGVDGARVQRVIYTHASDRFYERRRDQQQPPSPAGRYYGREHRY